jgi:hypothetical protein
MTIPETVNFIIPDITDEAAERFEDSMWNEFDGRVTDERFSSSGPLNIDGTMREFDKSVRITDQDN